MTLVDPDTGEVLVAISAEAARELTDRIKVGVEGVWLLVKAAYESRAWAALGYSSWDDYCTREFGASRIRLPREERAEVVASLRESGLSIRAIAAATGISDQTVQRDLSAGVVNHYTSEEEKVSGTDGKTYPARPTVMERLAEAKNNHPIEPIPFKSRAAVEARIAKAREMAAAGSTSRQIADEIGISHNGFIKFRERHGVDVPADKVVGKSGRIDSNRVVQTTVDMAESLSAGSDLYDLSAVDADRIDDWVDSLSGSIRFLTSLRNNLKKEQTQRG